MKNHKVFLYLEFIHDYIIHFYVIAFKKFSILKVYTINVINHLFESRFEICIAQVP